AGVAHEVRPDTQVRQTVEVGYGGNERLMMNMGPQHPSSHGVFRMILTLEGETVVGVDAVIGYLHRCHEKLGETLTYVQYPSIASKTDYVAAMTSELAYVSAVEKIARIDVPKRAQYLRVIAAELQRIASHCLWLGTWCLDMGGALGGGATVFLYAIRQRELAQDVGVSGPLIRGSGVNYDVRRAEPYSSYGDFDFVVPVETEGDCYARYRVRMVEFRQSIRIIRQALDGLPAGPISSRPGVKSVGQVRVPKGEGYARVEGARGEVGCYIISDGSPKPYRMKWRGASFSNLAVLPHIVPGHKVADVVAIMGSVDPVFGEVDR